MEWITDVKPKPFERVLVKTAWGEVLPGHWRDYGAWSCWEVEGEVSNGVEAWQPLPDEVTAEKGLESIY